jgi:hypothetical protein
VVRKKGNERQEQTDQLLKVPGCEHIDDEQDSLVDDDGHDVSNMGKCSRQSGRTLMGEPVSKSLGDTADESIRDEDPGKEKVHEEPKIKHKGNYEKNNALKTQMYEKPGMRAVIADIRMLKTILKGTDDKNMNVNHVMDKSLR